MQGPILKGGWILEERVQHFRKDTVVCTSHLLCGVVRKVIGKAYSIGGACTVDKEMLPLEAQYIALGHLHRPKGRFHEISGIQDLL